jgi:5'-phosphate synthase pdxT subunit
MPVGVLALQGSFFDHIKSLKNIGLNYILIKSPEDLGVVDSLILPGGESTAMRKINSFNNLFSNIDNLIKKGVPTLTTCAGTILVANKVIDGSPCMPNISITVHRNAYGRQNESFEGSVKFLDNNDIYCFIRAPKIVDYDKKEINVLSTHMDEIVGVQQKNVVSFTYHPELTNDEYYLEWLKQFIQEGKYVGSF